MTHWGPPQASKVIAEIEEDGDALLPWQCLYNYDNKITRACIRLEQIRDGERVLGYEESAQMYRDTANELRELRGWWHSTFQEAVNKRGSMPVNLDIDEDWY